MRMKMRSSETFDFILDDISYLSPDWLKQSLRESLTTHFPSLNSNRWIITINGL